MRFDILTIFPDMLKGILYESVIGRACKSGLIEINFHNIRDYSLDKHKKTDDIPYGGGFGMVMTPQPSTDCINAVKNTCKGNARTIYMSPRGRVFNQQIAKELCSYDNIIILCGHYEGLDQRVIDSCIDEELSIGDYVLTGGEMPAAVVVDAVSRLVPGVLKDNECFEKESIASGLLEHPQYTRPPIFNGLCVPEVLMGGNHALIDEWKRKKSLELTLKKRPDLLKNIPLSKNDLLFLEQLYQQNTWEFENE